MVLLVNEPSSPLEEILADALKRDKIPFESQYRVYEKQNDLAPKYTLDFLVRAGDKNIVVECDGDLFHNNPNEKRGTQ